MRPRRRPCARSRAVPAARRRVQALLRCTSPSSGRSEPARMRSSEDLPAPLRPIRPTARRLPAKIGVVQQGHVAEGELGVGEGDEGHGGGKGMRA
jgi:hypothetical protein